MGTHKHHSAPRHTGGIGPLQLLEDIEHARVHFDQFMSGEDPWFHGSLLKFLPLTDQQKVKTKMSELRQTETWWNNGKVEKRSVKQPEGNFSKGRLPYSDDSYQKISDSLTGQTWWTNGETEVRSVKQPEKSFRPGRLPHGEDFSATMSRVHKGKSWWNNGTIEVFRFDKPDGFVKGRKSKG
jgi:hypothetical protein